MCRLCFFVCMCHPPHPLSFCHLARSLVRVASVDEDIVLQQEFFCLLPLSLPLRLIIERCFCQLSIIVSGVCVFDREMRKMRRFLMCAHPFFFSRVCIITSGGIFIGYIYFYRTAVSERREHDRTHRIVYIRCNCTHYRRKSNYIC